MKKINTFSSLFFLCFFFSLNWLWQGLSVLKSLMNSKNLQKIKLKLILKKDEKEIWLKLLQIQTN